MNFVYFLLVHAAKGQMKVKKGGKIRPISLNSHKKKKNSLHDLSRFQKNFITSKYLRYFLISKNYFSFKEYQNEDIFD